MAKIKNYNDLIDAERSIEANYKCDDSCLIEMDSYSGKLYDKDILGQECITAEAEGFLLQSVGDLEFANGVLLSSGKTDKTKLQGAIKNTLSHKIMAIKAKEKKLSKVSLILFIFGFIILIGASLIGKYIDVSVLYEVAVIASWVFIWAAVEKFFFDRSKLKAQKLKYLQIYIATILD